LIGIFKYTWRWAMSWGTSVRPNSSVVFQSKVSQSSPSWAHVSSSRCFGLRVFAYSRDSFWWNWHVQDNTYASEAYLLDQIATSVPLNLENLTAVIFKRSLVRRIGIVNCPDHTAPVTLHQWPCLVEWLGIRATEAQILPHLVLVGRLRWLSTNSSRW
jgi:hypothetical protein